MSRRNLLSLLVFLLSQFSAAQTGETGLVRELDRREAKLEQLTADYWRADYRIARGEDKVSTLSIQKKIRNLLGDRKFLARLSAARFSDPVLERRRKLFREEVLHTLIYTDPRLASLVEAIEKDESGLRYEVGGKTLRRSELNVLVGHEKDRTLRMEGWKARAKNHGVTGERVRQTIALRNELARTHGAGAFVDFTLERKGLPDRKRIEAIFARALSETEDEYRKLLQRMRKDLGVETIEPWDLEFYFTTVTGGDEDRLFPRDAAWERTQSLCRSLGFDLDKLPVDLVVTDITFGGATYPVLYGKEVRILMNRYSGLRFTDTLMHEAGHGIHFSLNADASFILRANYSEPFGEGLGQVLAWMLYRPEIARKHFGLEEETARRLGEAARLKLLVDLRETIADALTEYQFYDDPSADLTVLYNRNYERIMGISLHGRPVWAFNPFYASGPVYIQSYALAEMFARQVHADLDRRFGREWGREAGEHLRRNYFTTGGRYTLDELLQRGTGQPLNPEALTEMLKGR